MKKLTGQFCELIFSSTCTMRLIKMKIKSNNNVYMTRTFKKKKRIETRTHLVHNGLLNLPGKEPDQSNWKARTQKLWPQ